MNLMEVECPPCRVCGIRGVLADVPVDSYIGWKSRDNVQDAFPQFDADQRELLMTGTHAHCWEIMWGGDPWLRQGS
jgi:hypothetical protein